VLDYKAENKISVEKGKAVAVVNQLLKRMLELLSLINSDDFSPTSIKQIFNIVMCVCVNTNVDPFVDVLRKCFDEFEKSALSDQFNDLLFQYTDNPFDLKQMFEETEDFSKFAFFANEVYLVNVTLDNVRHEELQTAVNV